MMPLVCAAAIAATNNNDTVIHILLTIMSASEIDERDDAREGDRRSIRKLRKSAAPRRLHKLVIKLCKPRVRRNSATLRVASRRTSEGVIRNSFRKAAAKWLWLEKP